MFRIVAIVLLTLCLTYAAWANSATMLFSKFSPERGLSLDPTSAQALMNITEKAGTMKDKSTFLKIARGNSVAALQSEPLSSRALRQLGTYYTMAGEAASLDAVKAGKDMDVTDFYLCPVCGYIELGSAPEKCPVCGALKKVFVQLD